MVETSRPGGKPLSFYVKIIAGVVTFLATVAGTWVAFVDRPAPYTAKDWTRKANAACEKDFGSITVPLYTLTPLIGQIAAQTPAVGVENKTIDDTVHTLAEMAGAFRKMSGDLREIDLPKDMSSADIDAMLKNTNEISDSLGVVAMFLTNFQRGTTTAAEGQTAIGSLQRVMATTIPAWWDRGNKLGLDQCLRLVGDPKTAPSIVPTTPPPGGLSLAEQGLVAKLASTILRKCTAAPKEENENVIAAVNCEAVRLGPTKRPLVLQFASNTALTGWINRIGGTATEQKCLKVPSKGLWHHGNDVPGSLVCANNDGGGTRITWTFDAQSVAILADGDDYDSIYKWWIENALVLSL
jgi:hypothetical protein